MVNRVLGVKEINKIENFGKKDNLTGSLTIPTLPERFGN